jgi:hypothetical protein
LQNIANIAKQVWSVCAQSVRVLDKNFLLKVAADHCFSPESAPIQLTSVPGPAEVVLVFTGLSKKVQSNLNVHPRTTHTITRPAHTSKHHHALLTLSCADRELINEI